MPCITNRCLNDPFHHLYHHYRLMHWESSLLIKECRSHGDTQILHQMLLSPGAFFPFPPPRPSQPRKPLSRLNLWELIKYEACRGLFDRAFSRCTTRRRHGSPLDSFTFPYLLKAHSDLPSHVLLASIHAVVSRQGFGSNVFVCNALVAMSGRCRIPSDARHLFEEMLDRGVDDVVSGNSLMASHPHDEELSPDEFSLVNVLAACGSLRACAQCKQVHGFAYRRGLFCDLFVSNTIIYMYAKCAMMKEPLAVFKLMEVKDVVSWKAMVTGFSLNGDFDRRSTVTWS